MKICILIINFHLYIGAIHYFSDVRVRVEKSTLRIDCLWICYFDVTEHAVTVR